MTPPPRTWVYPASPAGAAWEGQIKTTEIVPNSSANICPPRLIRRGFGAEDGRAGSFPTDCLAHPNAACLILEPFLKKQSSQVSVLGLFPPEYLKGET